MLWQIGSFVLLIDIFYRVSVPIDHLFKITLSDNNINDITPNNGLSQPRQNGIITNSQGVSLLIERISHASAEERKTWIQLLQTPPNQQQAKLAKTNQATTKGSKPSTRVSTAAPQNAGNKTTPTKKETQPKNKKGGTPSKSKGRDVDEPWLF